MLRQLILLVLAVLYFASAVPANSPEKTSIADGKRADVFQENLQADHYMKGEDMDTEETRYGWGGYGGGWGGYGPGWRGGYGRGWGGGWGGGYGRGWGGGRGWGWR